MATKNVPEEITKALLELMKTEEYDSISITDIVNKANVSRVTYYRHFSSKEDILKKFFISTKDSFLEQTKLGFATKNNEFIILALFLFFKSNMEANKAIRKSHLDHMLLEFLSTEFTDNLPAKLDKFTAAFVSGALYNVMITWLDNDCKDSIEEVSKPFIELDRINVQKYKEIKEKKENNSL